MSMTKEEFNEKATAILNIEDKGAMSTSLDELRTAYFEEVDSRVSAETKATELEEKNRGLQEANMELFLKVGKAGTGVEEKPEPPTPEPPVDEDAVYAELFDEKGELK